MTDSVPEGLMNGRLVENRIRDSEGFNALDNLLHHFTGFGNAWF
jgi:hypothetical protein